MGARIAKGGGAKRGGGCPPARDLFPREARVLDPRELELHRTRGRHAATEPLLAHGSGAVRGAVLCAHLRGGDSGGHRRAREAVG